MMSLDRVVAADGEQRTDANAAADNHVLPTPKRAVKKAHRSGALATPVMAALKPDQIAFLGEHAAHHKGTSAKAFVQVLCWPTMPDAWPLLTRTCATLVALRSEMFSTGTVPVARSWVHSVAPQLSLPFSRDAGAEESTLATLIARLPARFIAAVVEPDGAKIVASDLSTYRLSLSGCLSAYNAFLNAAQERARRVIIARLHKGAQDQNLLEAYKEVRGRLDDRSSGIKDVDLRLWSESAIPLPLEIADLAAAAISRYLQEPKQANPIFDAVRSKLVNPPPRLESRPRR